MLLFPRASSTHSSKEVKPFYLLSPRSEIIQQLSQQLRMTGLDSIQGIEGDILHQDAITVPAQAQGIIIDIGDCDQSDRVIQAIRARFPCETWCSVIGNSDSIALAQSFAHHNICYFNIRSQLNELIQGAVAGVHAKTNRLAIGISVLGCKGGVGSTTIGYQLANQISSLKKMSALFVQGAYGSRDLDLHTGKKMTAETTPVHKHLDVMNGKTPLLPDLSQDIMQKYNFVVFEQSIGFAEKELLRDLTESSSWVILVIDRSMAAARVAHNMVETMQIAQRTSPMSRRLVICLNDIRPIVMDTLAQDDIQSLIAHPIDVVFPYSASGLKTPTSRSRFGRKVAPIEQLANEVLGVNPPRRSLFNALWTNRERSR
ncbi:Flp operon protein D (plasmid) [Sodalis praecaptivus]|uniref:Flp operon protein D n=1 Tax=Sodalis praecaptivus TaxID=1239307 RepID=W0I3R6_9GAMM|nr:hypothetical protein [Sodalis praecaptivus]AHF79110.1 Flp operon protein D [Sodalis praecaptivus]